MDVIKNMLFAAQHNFQSWEFNFKLDVESLESFGNILHGPEYLHGTPLIIFVLLLFSEAFRAIYRALGTYALTFYQIVGISLLLQVIFWPLILIQLAWGLYLQELLYLGIYFTYDYCGLKCGVPSYRTLYWDDARPEPCYVPQESLGLAASFAVLFVVYLCDYGRTVTNCWQLMLERIVVLVKGRMMKLLWAVIWSLSYVYCQLKDVMVDIVDGLTHRVSSFRTLKISCSRSGVVATASASSAPELEAGEPEDSDEAQHMQSRHVTTATSDDNEDTNGDNDLISFDSDCRDQALEGGWHEWTDQNESACVGTDLVEAL